MLISLNLLCIQDFKINPSSLEIINWKELDGSPATFMHSLITLLMDIRCSVTTSAHQSKILSPVENNKNMKELKTQSNPGMKNTALQLSGLERSA